MQKPFPRDNHPHTTVTFLGMADVLPGPGEDTASFLINDTFLVDCGWYAVLKMQQYEFNPLEINTLFLTHCHHDHYMGLPAFLFYRGMKSHNTKSPLPPLRLIGPADDLPIVIERSHAFLQAERFPEIWPSIDLVPLEPGESYETENYRLQTILAIHPVTALSTCYEDKQTGTRIAFTGDTSPNDELIDLARNARLLIHEASLPDGASESALHSGHSRPTDAARLAKAAKVQELRLIHLREPRKDAVLAAREIFAATNLANEGETITL